MRYALVGYGRMGRAVEAEAERRGHRRTAIFDLPAAGLGGGEKLESRDLAEADVAFEFTVGSAAERNILTLIDSGVAVVCGTTGWRASADLERTMRDSPAGIVVAPNFSVGVNLFYRIVAEAARLHGAAGLHQPFLVESHHRGKLDAPSGTARRLAEIVVDADPRLESVHEGNPGAPLADDVLQVVSVRAGSDAGRHTVGFDGAHDRITLTHEARSRAGFALGAVLAAEWIRGKPGLHGFDEVLDDLLRSRSSGKD